MVFEAINLKFIGFMLGFSIVMILFQFPIYMAFKRKNKKFKFYHLFYIPKGTKKKAFYVHLIGLSTGIIFFLAKVVSIPIYILLTFLGYTGSTEYTERIILALGIIYVFTLIINNYRPKIEKSLEKRWKIDVRG